MFRLKDPYLGRLLPLASGSGFRNVYGPVSGRCYERRECGGNRGRSLGAGTHHRVDMTVWSRSSSEWPQNNAAHHAFIDRHTRDQGDPAAGSHEMQQCGPIVHSVRDLRIEAGDGAGRERTRH